MMTHIRDKSSGCKVTVRPEKLFDGHMPIICAFMYGFLLIIYLHKGFLCYIHKES